MALSEATLQPSRFEFAAGLNACLNQVERLIASSTADFVRIWGLPGTRTFNDSSLQQFFKLP